MSKPPILLSLCSLTTLILVLNIALVNSNGLTIRLIHPNSPESPFFQNGDSTHGMQARETFYLRSKNGGLAKMENIQFGCGLHNVMKYGAYKNNKIAGTMGLGWDDISFVKQLGPKANGKFSYCLPVLSSGKTSSTFLRFGDDIVHNKNSKSTPLYRRKEKSPYYVELQGISINKTKLNISPEVFAFKNDDRSGCMIDSGLPYSRIITPAFDKLKLELEKYFSRFKGLKKIKGNLGLELCYQRSKPEGFNNLPDITFHLQGSQADFVLKAAAAFEVVGRSLPIRFHEYFCLAMIRENEVSVIGAHQQTNHRIIHDTKNKQLLFYPEDCSKNP
ncbi:hypothetical protein DH2020_024924 [Rehmannia glutinosa]|uniref:Peptidase A1 domain-containing protein n=1 Tax=Rehmannia glutinosa TaxID=99300 RepID=A0ABR0W3T2_REHGL